MSIPADLHYSKNDEWIKVEGETAMIGISDYAQDQLSDIVYLEVNLKVGDRGKQGDLMGTVESVKAAADLYLPVAGEVIEVNDALGDVPETINDDPYNGGWMLKIKIPNPGEIDELMDAKAYQKYIEEREA